MHIQPIHKYWSHFVKLQSKIEKELEAGNESILVACFFLSWDILLNGKMSQLSIFLQKKVILTVSNMPIPLHCKENELSRLNWSGWKSSFPTHSPQLCTSTTQNFPIFSFLSWNQSSSQLPSSLSLLSPSESDKRITVQGSCPVTLFIYIETSYETVQYKYIGIQRIDA